MLTDDDPRTGIDYSWGRPDLDLVRQAGYSFIVRYLSFDRTGKNLTRAEAEQAANAGLELVLNWQNKRGDYRGGGPVGRIHGRAARLQADLIGARRHSPPIYVSIDEDTSADPTLMNAAVDYLAAFQEEIEATRPYTGRYFLGVYGGLDTIRRIDDEHMSGYLWQTRAWSGTPTEWHPDAVMRQHAHNQTLPGYPTPDGARKPQAVDYNTTHRAYFGQWNPTT